jgi:hypothetical protein
MEQTSYPCYSHMYPPYTYSPCLEACHRALVRAQLGAATHISAILASGFEHAACGSPATALAEELVRYIICWVYKGGHAAPHARFPLSSPSSSKGIAYLASCIYNAKATHTAMKNDSTQAGTQQDAFKRNHGLQDRQNNCLTVSQQPELDSNSSDNKFPAFNSDKFITLACR